MQKFSNLFIVGGEEKLREKFRRAWGHVCRICMCKIFRKQHLAQIKTATAIHFCGQHFTRQRSNRISNGYCHEIGSDILKFKVSIFSFKFAEIFDRKLSNFLLRPMQHTLFKIRPFRIMFMKVRAVKGQS
jgi:hypothetical protein